MLFSALPVSWILNIDARLGQAFFLCRAELPLPYSSNFYRAFSHRKPDSNNITRVPKNLNGG